MEQSEDGMKQSISYKQENVWIFLSRDNWLWSRFIFLHYLIYIKLIYERISILYH